MESVRGNPGKWSESIRNLLVHNLDILMGANDSAQTLFCLRPISRTLGSKWNKSVNLQQNHKNAQNNTNRLRLLKDHYKTENKELKTRTRIFKPKSTEEENYSSDIFPGKLRLWWRR